MTNSITEVTRRNLFDDLRIAKVNWSGRLGEDEFLARVFDLTTLRSNDRRCANMGAEIWFHRSNFRDWEDDWVFDDSRVNLLRSPDDVLLNFLCQMIHPVVRQDADECAELARQFNGHLAADGF
jgi:hypothetical protein